MTYKLPRIRKVFGPLKTVTKGHCIVWTFTGIREDNEFCRWSLVFTFSTRRYSVRRHATQPGDEKLMTPGLFPAYEGSQVHVSRIGPLLREMLKPEHIALATLKAIEYTGRRA